MTATNEAQVSGFDFNDYISIVANKGPMIEARLRFTVVPAANQRFVFGLVSAFSAVFDNIVTNAMFRIEGAGGALLVETDDGTTDTDDQASNPANALVDATDYTFLIDMRDTSSVKFYFDGAHVGTTSMAAIGNSRLQPAAYFQKDSGTGTGGFTIDYVRIQYDRV